MTYLELIAQLMEHISHSPAIGECEANISVSPGDTTIDVDLSDTGVEVEGAR